MKCRACGFEHDSWVRCDNAARLRANGETPLDQPALPVAPWNGVGVDRPERRPVAPQVKQAQDFIRKVGRPRIYADPKERRKIYMREWRLRAKS